MGITKTEDACIESSPKPSDNEQAVCTETKISQNLYFQVKIR